MDKKDNLKRLKLTTQDKEQLTEKTVKNVKGGGNWDFCYACGLGGTIKLHFAVDMYVDLACDSLPVV